MPTLARSSVLAHPSGTRIETPLLIPSFSSKGFGFAADGSSEVKNILTVAKEFLSETMLVSAYDIHQMHLPPIGEAITELAFVDSGGYETSDQQDLSDVFVQRVERSDWDETKLRGVLDAWPERVPAAFVNFDSSERRIPIEDQASDARRFFAGYRSHLHVFLAKPESSSQRYLDATSICRQVECLRGFSVLGFTEKELGNSLLKRMKAIARIRLELDEQQIFTPIHVFGSLDPISVALYFVAGAEIFDGLTWLRYGYSDGAAMYRHDFGARHVGIHERDDYVRVKTMQSNVSFLQNLKVQMRKFLLDQDFARFGRNADLIRESFDELRTAEKRLR